MLVIVAYNSFKGCNQKMMFTLQGESLKSPLRLPTKPELRSVWAISVTFHGVLSVVWLLAATQWLNQKPASIWQKSSTENQSHQKSKQFFFPLYQKEDHWGICFHTIQNSFKWLIKKTLKRSDLLPKLNVELENLLLEKGKKHLPNPPFLLGSILVVRFGTHFFSVGDGPEFVQAHLPNATTPTVSPWRHDGTGRHVVVVVVVVLKAGEFPVEYKGSTQLSVAMYCEKYVLKNNRNQNCMYLLAAWSSCFLTPFFAAFIGEHSYMKESQCRFVELGTWSQGPPSSVDTIRTHDLAQVSKWTNMNM